MHDGSPGPGPDGGDEAPFDGGMSSDAGANSRPDNDASAPPDGVRACTSDALGGCTRGMYVSLYTDHIGTLALDEDPAGNTEKFRYILGNTSKEDTLLAYASAHEIHSLSLYNLYAILGDTTLREQLTAFMARARLQGITRFDAIGDGTLAGWDRIAEFHAKAAPFDGLVTEIEFWNESATRDELLTTLQYVRELGLETSSGQPLPLAVYAGWFDGEDAAAIAPLIDRMYVHAYVDSPDRALGYVEERMALLQAENDAQGLSLEVWPIFSAEDTAWAAGAEHFMGEWLSAHSLDEAERTFLAAYEASDLTIRVTGQQYYEYVFLALYVP